ncbi:hypothetical protein DEU51_11478 [Pseudomonas jessenii]|uniref:Uncharacterized protein n=1 Tax=Pseudomonas jessenii TaxID=77298 RepID=A0A370S976_PSEJE|nr:hypothetical protein DEU51_11478 [Pseudomonas jessenii]
MLSKTTTSQDEKRVVAFEKTTVKIFLVATDDSIAIRDPGFSIKNNMVDVEYCGLQPLSFDSTFLALGEHDVKDHPVSHHAKWLTFELLACQLD